MTRQGQRGHPGNSGHALLLSEDGLPPGEPWQIGLVQLAEGREKYEGAERIMREAFVDYKSQRKTSQLLRAEPPWPSNRPNLALAYFEKVNGNIITVKGDRVSDLIGLYEEIADTEEA